MKKLIICIILLFAVPIYAQIEKWIYTYNGPADNADEAHAIVYGADGNIYAAGFSFDVVGDNDFTILSTDNSGNERWVYTFDGPGHLTDGAQDISFGTDANVYAAGWSHGGTGDIDLTVISVDSGGDERWAYRYNGTGNYVDNAFSIAYGLDNNIYAAGFTFTFASGVTDFIVVSLTPTGNVRWIYKYDGGGRPWNSANSIIYGPDNYIYAAGYCGGTSNDVDFCVICLDTAGNEEWIYKHNGPGNDDDEARSIIYGLDNNLYVAGYSSGSSTGTDFAVISLSTSGNENWVYRYNGSENTTDRANSIIYGPDNYLYAAGLAYNTGADSDFVVASLTPSGSERWVYTYNGPNDFTDVAHSLVYGSDSNIYAAGYSFGNGTREDFTIISLKSTGEELGVYRYNGTRNFMDKANAITYGLDSSVYAAGMSFNNNTIVDLTIISLEPVFGTEEHSSSQNPRQELILVSLFFSDKIKMHFSKASSSSLEITLYNILGELVYDTRVHLTPTLLEIKDSRLAQLPKGVYFLSVMQGNMVYPNEKIIKYQ